MVQIRKILKFATIYYIANLFSFAAEDDAKAAVGRLVSLIDTGQELVPIGQLYQTIKDPQTPKSQAIEAANAFKELINDLKTKYSKSEYIFDISNSLNIIYNEAISDLNLNEKYENIYSEDVESATELVGVQEGEEEAKAGGFAVTEDIYKKRERERLRQQEKRKNPLEKQKTLDSQKRYEERIKEKIRQDPSLHKEYSLKKKFKENRLNLIKFLVHHYNMTKEEAINYIDNKIQQGLANTVQERGLSKEEVISDIISLKNDEIKNLSKSLRRQRKVVNY